MCLFSASPPWMLALRDGLFRGINGSTEVITLSKNLKK